MLRIHRVLSRVPRVRAMAACPITGHGGKVPNFINGQFVESKATEHVENLNPATQELISLVPKSTGEEMREAIEGAKVAQAKWKTVPPQVRFDMASESVFFEGFNGKKDEYCPYTETSKAYDQTRAPLGLNIFLGSMALLDTPMSEQKLLDIGCGTGTFLECVSPHVKEACGLEYNDGMIAEARKKNMANVSLTQGSADKLPYADASFDVCTINQVIHHFPKEDNYAFNKRAFAEAYRVLKPGGIFVINTSMPEQQRDAFWWLSLFPGAGPAVCSRFPPMAVLMGHLKAAGFTTDGDSVCVPSHRTLMAESVYLRDGVKMAFEKWYRDGDSSWSMAENFGELDAGLDKLRKMINDGTADAWLAEREALRLSMGQATFITADKNGLAEMSGE